MKIKHFSLSLGEQLFKALGDPNRLRLLNLLRKYGPICSADLEQVLEFTQTKTSRHLHYLKNARVLNSRRQDHYVFFSINDELAEIINTMLGYVEKDAVLQADIENYRVMHNNRVLAINRMQGRNYVPL